MEGEIKAKDKRLEWQAENLMNVVDEKTAKLQSENKELLEEVERLDKTS